MYKFWSIVFIHATFGQQFIYFGRNLFDGNWEAANEFCTSRLGTLPTVHSQTQNELTGSACQATTCWIGLRSPSGTNHQESTWEWTDGSSVDFSDWTSGDPSGPYSIARCARISNSGIWQADHCNKLNRGIICQFLEEEEVSPSAPPSPEYISPAAPPSPGSPQTDVPTDVPTDTPTEIPTDVSTEHPTSFESSSTPFVTSIHTAVPTEGTHSPIDEIPESPTQPTQKKRHILFILTDDMGFSDVSYNGAEYETPNIDALAAESVRLANYYVQQTCSPTRAALFTGRQPAELGLQNNVFAKMLGTSLDETFLSEKLHELGYQTHLVGKWHLAYGNWDDSPIGKGFDSFFGLFGGYFNYFSHDEDGSTAAKCSYQYKPSVRYVETSSQGYDLWDFDSNNPQKGPYGIGAGYRYEGIYATRLWKERVVDIVREYNEDDDPMFILLATNSPHEPWQVPFEYYNHTECAKTLTETRRIYCGMVRSLDEAVGEIVEELKVTGLYEDTYIIFSSDNGGSISTTIEFREPPAQSNAPLRCGKTTVFEGGQRVIGFVKGPTLNPRDSDQLFHISDWFLTLQSMAGNSNTPATIKVKNSTLVSSYNQWPALHTPNIHFRQNLLYNVFWDFEANAPAQKGAVRDLEYKLVVGGNQFTRNGWFDASGRASDRIYCLGATNCAKKPSVNWFKISEDPEEKENNGDGRPLPPTDEEELEHYNALHILWNEWRAVTVESAIPEIEDREFDAQAYAELWNCHWQPWISTENYPIELTAREDCHSRERLTLQCRSGCETKDCWKCAAGWPDADPNDCPQPQPRLEDIPDGFSDVFGIRSIEIELDVVEDEPTRGGQRNNLLQHRSSSRSSHITLADSSTSSDV